VNEAEQKRRVQQRQPLEILREPIGEDEMIREDHRRGRDTAVPIAPAWTVALNVLPAPSFSSSSPRAGEIDVDAVLAPERFPDAGDLLDDRRARKTGLGVVGHRAVGVDRDGDGTHPKNPNRHEPEREHRRREQ